MNESGINSFDEFLLFYLAFAFVIGALWAILEADLLLGPSAGARQRRLRHRTLSYVLAPLGVAHIAFALIAMDINRADELDQPGDETVRRRAAWIARVGTLAGIVVLVALWAPHVPAFSEFPGMTAVEQTIPWE